NLAAGTGQTPHATGPSALADVAGQFLAVEQVTMIVGMALLEGTGFMGCIAYLQEAQPLALGVVGVVVVLMFLKFPTAQRVRARLERMADQLTEMRWRQEAA